MTSQHRRAAVGTTVVGLVLLVAVAAWRVPWDPVAGPVLRAPAAGDWFTPAQVARGEDFASWARVWSLSSVLVSLAVACWFGLTRAGRSLVEGLPGPWWLRTALCVTVLTLLGRVVTLPFAVLQRRRVRAFGLSEQDWWGFAADLVRTQVVTIAATTVAVLVLLGIARRWPRTWPAVAGATLGVLVLLGSFAYPVLVEPVFNRFTALPPGPLRTDILALAEREGVRVDNVLVADASRRTTTLNAYVSGYGSTRRVVLYDTLVDDLPADETLSVVAHELTHARHDDVLTGSVLGALGAATGVGLLGLLLVRRTEHEEPVGAGDVPRLLALVAVASLLVGPVQHGISRQIETRADVGALEATRDPAGFIRLQQELAARSVADLTPPPAWQWWFGSHPTTVNRIALALRVQDEGG
ncbi:MAG: M48 family metallopeptidase [Nocardioides sp.]|nr:M48 family metallopeptidase [Nocardioides sp.]